MSLPGDDGSPAPTCEQVLVPLAALKQLVDYTDSLRSIVDQEFTVGAGERADSDREFRGIVDALEVPDLADVAERPDPV